MITLIAGQVIRQKNNDRIWRIEGPAPPSRLRPDDRGRRWRIILVTPSPVFDDRIAGEFTDCTETWLNSYCEDFSTTIDPPCGDGAQVVRICLANRRIVNERLFHRAAEAVAFCAEQLAEGHSDHAEWYGWVVEAADQLPDLVARLTDDELVWAEVVHGVS